MRREVVLLKVGQVSSENTIRGVHVRRVRSARSVRGWTPEGHRRTRNGGSGGKQKGGRSDRTWRSTGKGG